jgi:hypothetical protein
MTEWLKLVDKGVVMYSSLVFALLLEKQGLFPG